MTYYPSKLKTSDWTTARLEWPRRHSSINL